MFETIAQEPVRFWAVITGLIVAVFAALVGFEIVNWTQEQIALILGVFAALGVVFQFFFVRNQVTPLVRPMNNQGEVLIPAGSGPIVTQE